MAVAIPLIAGSTTETATGENEGYAFRAEKVDTSTGTTEITITRENDHAIVNGIDIGAFSTYPTLIGDGVLMLFVPNTTSRQVGIGNTEVAMNALTWTIGTDGITITITDGTVTNGNITYTGVDWFIIPSEDGPLGAMTSAKVTETTTCYWAKTTSRYVSSISANLAVGMPTAADSITVHYGLSTGTSGQAVVQTTAVSSIAVSEDKNGIMTVGALTMAEALGGVSELPLAFAPIEYSYNVPGTGTVATLVGLIPLLMMVGLILAVVSAYLTKKMEE